MSIYNDVLLRKPRKSAFNLSYSKLFTCRMGQLIPIMCDEAIPGDLWMIAVNALVRFMPMLTPPLTPIDVIANFYFAPKRGMWNNSETDSYEAFLTGGVDGTLHPTMPEWAPTNTAIGSLWDYLGLPVGVDPVGFRPYNFIRYTYNWIYNEYLRDQNLIPKVSLDNEAILKHAWGKDYFTSALPWQQRGVSPGFPVAGLAPLQWGSVSGSNLSNASFDYITDGGTHPYNASTKTFLESGRASLTTATTWDVNFLRQAIQTQRFLERSARTGSRLVEFLRAHYGVSPRDERLQRPEYIGGYRGPVITSEVLQTSGTGITGQTTGQGTMAGHGMHVARKFIAKYHVEEPGIIMGIMTIQPRASYSQGVPRQFRKPTRYDEYFIEFANTSEQPVYQAELFADNNSTNNNRVFGYQGRYNEHRAKQDIVCGQFRSTGNMPFWHLGRFFASAPLLNQSFIETDSASLSRIFQVTSDIDNLIVNWGNIIKCIRPMPLEPDPGFMDHN